MFNEADYKCAVSEIMTGTKQGCLSVIQKLRDQLERSSTEIFPFFEACSRKVHKTNQLGCMYKIIVNELKSEIRKNPCQKSCEIRVKNPIRNEFQSSRDFSGYYSNYTIDESSDKMSILTVSDLPSDGDERFGSKRSGSRLRDRNSIGGNSGDGATLYVSGIPCAESESNVFNFLLGEFPNAESIHVPTNSNDGKIKGVAFVQLKNQFKDLDMNGLKLRINRVVKQEGGRSSGGGNLVVEIW